MLGLALGSPPRAGTALMLEIVSATPTPMATRPPAPTPLSLLAHEWPALSRAIEAVRQTSPSVGAGLLEHVVPRPGTGLAGGLLFFLAALRAGDIRSWLGGRASQALEATGQNGLIARLGDDVGQMARLADPDGPGQWRTFLIPLYDGERLQQIRLSLRRRDQGGGADDEGDETGVRFMVEAELSRIGPLQIDGLLRGRRLQMVLRSRYELSGAMRRELTEIFMRATGPGGLEGGLSFQTGDRFPSAPLEELPGEHAVMIV